MDLTAIGAAQWSSTNLAKCGASATTFRHSNLKLQFTNTKIDRITHQRPNNRPDFDQQIYRRKQLKRTHRHNGKRRYQLDGIFAAICRFCWCARCVFSPLCGIFLALKLNVFQLASESVSTERPNGGAKEKRRAHTYDDEQRVSRTAHTRSESEKKNMNGSRCFGNRNIARRRILTFPTANNARFQWISECKNLFVGQMILAWRSPLLGWLAARKMSPIEFSRHRQRQSVFGPCSVCDERDRARGGERVFLSVSGAFGVSQFRAIHFCWSRYSCSHYVFDARIHLNSITHLKLGPFPSRTVRFSFQYTLTHKKQKKRERECESPIRPIYSTHTHNKISMNPNEIHRFRTQFRCNGGPSTRTIRLDRKLVSQKIYRSCFSLFSLMCPCLVW